MVKVFHVLNFHPNRLQMKIFNGELFPNGISMTNTYKETEKQQNGLIGYSGFISHDWFFITWGRHIDKHSQRIIAYMP